MEQESIRLSQNEVVPDDKVIPEVTIKVDKEKWFAKIKPRPEFKKTLNHYYRDERVSMGEAIAIHYLPEVNRIAERRVHGIQYFRRLTDLKYLP